MRRTVLLLTAVTFLVSSDPVGASSIYHWRDARGVPHYSNIPHRTPDSATAVTLAPVAFATATRTVRPAPGPGVVRKSHASRCAAGDPSALIRAVVRRLDTRTVDDLTLLVAGVPVSYDSDSVVSIFQDEVVSDAGAAVEQGAIAYPAGAICPSRPPLARYPVGNGRANGTSLCDDYRRAFAHVGVAVNRDRGVARSFRAIAARFADVAADGYVARPAGGGAFATRLVAPLGARPASLAIAPSGVAVPPWIVDAHVAQADELGSETEEVVEELAAALEEIDRAARDEGCW